MSSAMWSWSPQSQRSDSNRSPVKQDECNRTSGAVAFSGSPSTNTIGCCDSYFTPYAMILPVPYFVGSMASASR